MERRFDDLGREPQCATGGIGGTGVLVVMRPGQAGNAAQIDGPDLLAAAIFRQEAFAREDLPTKTRELAVHRHADHPVVGRPFAELSRQKTPFGFIHANDGTIRPAFSKEPPFGREIAPHARMAIQMIGAKVGEDGDIRRQIARQIGLVARQLQHHDLAVNGRLYVQHPATDVSRQLRRATRVLENVMHQRRGGGFPVRPGDRDDLGHHVKIIPGQRREALKEQPDVIVHRHTCVLRGDNHRVRCRIKMRNAGRYDQPRDVIKDAGLAQIHTIEPFGLRGGARGGVVIPTDRHSAPGGQRTGRRQPRPPEPQNGDLCAGQTLNWYHACSPVSDDPETFGAPYAPSARDFSPAQRRHARHG